MNILIIDDEEIILTLLEDFIEGIDSKIKVITTSNPQDAVNIIRNESIVFVISDYKMPELNGLELLKLLKDDEKLTPYFCLMSGDIPKEVFKVEYETDIRILRKPFSFADLKKMVQEIQKLTSSQTTDQATE